MKQALKLRSIDLAEMPHIRNYLCNFNFISWNTSGISKHKLEHVFAETSMYDNPAVIFIQEFDSEFVSFRAPATIVNHRIFSSNGISGPSRSNAIAIQCCLMPLVATFDSNPIANGLLLHLGCFWIVLLNLHLPYHDHDHMSFEETLENVHDFAEVMTQHAIKRGAKARNIFFLGAGDLNADLRNYHDKHDRTSPIRNFMNHINATVVEPEVDTLISHVRWKNHAGSLLDWAFVSSALFELWQHPSKPLASVIAEPLVGIIHTDHKPLKT
jgi:hypothetical protein